MASDTSIVRSQVFFTAQAAHYGVARSPRLVEKSRITAGPPFLIGADLAISAQQTGLLLGINDKGVDNNSGTFVANVQTGP